MTHAVKMGGRGVLNALVVGGADLRTALVEPQPGESSGLAGAVHAQHPTVEVAVRHIDARANRVARGSRRRRPR